MRDRLIELLRESENKVQKTLKEKLSLDLSERIGIYADYLLANGVIVPPCKLGDTIYDISEFINHCNSPEIYEDKVGFITIMKRENGEVYFDIE